MESRPLCSVAEDLSSCQLGVGASILPFNSTIIQNVRRNLSVALVLRLYSHSFIPKRG